MHLRGDVTLADQRPVGAGGDGDVEAVRVIEDADRVRGRLLERLIARHGGHAEQSQLGAGECEQQRDRVVVARVAVEDDVGHGGAHRSTEPPSATSVWPVIAACGVGGEERDKLGGVLGDE